MRRVTHLARTLDLRLPSNRWAVGIALACGVVAMAWSPDFSSAGRVAVASFLGWTIGRELDPDRPWSAPVAGLASGLLPAALGPPRLGASVILLLAARLLVRSIGLPPTLPDTAAVAGLASALAGDTAGWVAGLTLAFAMARDAGLPDPAPRRQLAWALVTAAGVTVVAGWNQVVGGWTSPGVVELGLAAVGTMAGASLPPEQPLSVADITGRRLNQRRLASARRTVLAALLLAAAFGGGSGIAGLTPGWVAVIAGAVAARIGGTGRG
ncbi:MAG: hypothetical protein ACRDVM_01910 [Acidimicrobiia bacterium]